MNDRIDELLRLIEGEPEALRTAEFLQTQDVLRGLVGQSVVEASIEDTRITIVAADGRRYYFYGFLGAQATG
jgi:hypothetical protein